MYCLELFLNLHVDIALKIGVILLHVAQFYFFRVHATKSFEEYQSGIKKLWRLK